MVKDMQQKEIHLLLGYSAVDCVSWVKYRLQVGFKFEIDKLVIFGEQGCNVVLCHEGVSVLEKESVAWQLDSQPGGLTHTMQWMQGSFIQEAHIHHSAR